MVNINITPRILNDTYRLHKIIIDTLSAFGYRNIIVNGSIKLGRFNNIEVSSFADFKLQIRNNPNADFSLNIRGAQDSNFALANYTQIFINKITIIDAKTIISCQSDNSEKLLEVIETIENEYHNPSTKVVATNEESSSTKKSTIAKPQNKYDVFISHASANKEDYVRKLVASIKKVTPNVWYDEDMLKWGDDLLKEIIDGLEHTEFAIVVFSKDFFGREWTERELKELLEKQNRLGKKIVLPLLYDCTQQEFLEKYKSLSLIKFVEAKKCSIEEVTLQFAGLLIDRKSKQQL